MCYHLVDFRRDFRLRLEKNVMSSYLLTEYCSVNLQLSTVLLLYLSMWYPGSGVVLDCIIS